MRALGRVTLFAVLGVAACLPRPQPAQPQVVQPSPQPSAQPSPQPYPQPSPQPYPQPQPPILFDATAPPTTPAPAPTTADGAEIEPYDIDPKDWTTSEPVRLMSSMGVSGAPSAFEPALAFGTRNSRRASDLVNVGIHTRLVLANWSQMRRFYGYIVDCEEIDTRCDKRADYWPIGWAIGLSSAELGWDVMVRREGPNRPWVSFGSTFVVFTDGSGFGEDGSPTIEVGHAGTLGAGYDFDIVGIGVRITAARDWLLFATSGASHITALISIDLLLPRDHEDRRKR